jgi:hypothetical protein
MCEPPSNSARIAVLSVAHRPAAITRCPHMAHSGRSHLIVATSALGGKTDVENQDKPPANTNAVLDISRLDAQEPKVRRAIWLVTDPATGRKTLAWSHISQFVSIAAFVSPKMIKSALILFRDERGPRCRVVDERVRDAARPTSSFRASGRSPHSTADPHLRRDPAVG